MLSNSSLNPEAQIFFFLKHRFLHYRNKQTFLIGESVLIVMVPLLIDKDMLEPSYSDLKSTVNLYQPDRTDKQIQQTRGIRD